MLCALIWLCFLNHCAFFFLMEVLWKPFPLFTYQVKKKQASFCTSSICTSLQDWDLKLEANLRKIKYTMETNNQKLLFDLQ